MATVKYRDENGNLISVGAGLHTHSPSSIGAAEAEHPHDVATATNDGFLSSTDKTKIDNLNDTVFGNADKEVSSLVEEVTNLVDLVGDEPVSEQIADAIGSLINGDTIVDKATHADTATALLGIKTAGTGAAYTATVPNITALSAGVSFIMIPHENSTSTTPTLNVNQLGAKEIRRGVSQNAYGATSFPTTSWAQANSPFIVIYDGSYWIVKGQNKPVASDLSGTVGISKGGTGATTAEAALINLGLTATAAELNCCDGVTSNIQTQLNNKVGNVTGKGLSTNDYTTPEKNKLSTIEEGATKTVIDSTLSSSSTNPVQNKVVYDKFNTMVGDKPVSEQISSAVSGKVDQVNGKGLSTEDYTTAEKTKLAGIDEGANKYEHPTFTSKTLGLYKVAVTTEGHVSSATAVTKSDITGLGIPAQDTTYSNATTSAAGLMSAADKMKLDNMFTHVVVESDDFDESSLTSDMSIITIVV